MDFSAVEAKFPVCHRCHHWNQLSADAPLRQHSIRFVPKRKPNKFLFCYGAFLSNISKYDYARRRLRSQKNRRSKESTERKNCNLTKFILHWDVPWKLNRTRPKEEKLSLPKDMNARAHSRLLQLLQLQRAEAVDLNRFFRNVFSFVRFSHRKWHRHAFGQHTQQIDAAASMCLCASDIWR